MTTIEKARNAYITYLENECGDHVVSERIDGIMSGREDQSDFIAGYLAAIEEINQ